MASLAHMLDKMDDSQETSASEVQVRPRVTTGILPCQIIQEMIRAKEIMSTVEIQHDQVQPASIDLRLGTIAYRVTTSFLPHPGIKVLEKMRQLDEHFDTFKIDLQNGAVLERGRIYVIPLLEAINLKADVMGFANPKSSTGRLDILTRLICDNGTVFDQVDAGYSGQLYVEVAPQSFDIVVKTGTRLNQLRFERRRKGVSPVPISSDEWKELLSQGRVVQQADSDLKASEERGMVRFTVDLRGDGSLNALIGWRAKKNSMRIDLEKRDYDPLDFWEPIRFHKRPSLILDPSEFYILMTREPVAVPPTYAAEMLPYDTRAGEFRVHYAGFFDPGFGWNYESKKAGSSRAVLEVRSHEVPFLLEHGQVVGWLKYERMSSQPEKLYGQNVNSNYQGQSLKLAKQFLPISPQS